MEVFDTSFQRKLIAERYDLRKLISALNAKNRRKLENERKAIAAAYEGRGRPKNPRPISKDDQAKEIQYLAELEVLDAALHDEVIAAPQLLEKCLLELTKKSTPYKDGRAKTYRRCRDKKIEGLLARLPNGRQSNSIRRQPWQEEEVRRYLQLVLVRNIEAALEFRRFPRNTSEYRRKLLDLKSSAAAAQRLLHSHHLSSRDILIRRAETIIYEPGLLAAGIVTAETKLAWKLAVTELVEELKLRFCEPSSKSEAHAKGGTRTEADARLEDIKIRPYGFAPSNDGGLAKRDAWFDAGVDAGVVCA
jgi:hypothetical protein